MVRILLVCMGNICRSPMAQVVGTHAARARGLDKQFQFDSAGTCAVRGGTHPDPRAKSTLERKGYDMPKRRARDVNESDFERFDMILGMDAQNIVDLKRVSSKEHLHKIRLFLDFAPGLEGTEVPDPYFGNREGFERVLKFCEAGAGGLLALPPDFRLSDGGQ